MPARSSTRARPDAYFNEGILTQEYKAKGAGDTTKAVAVYQQAKQVFQTFLDKASGKTEYDGAVKKTKERMQDIDDTVTFLQAGGPSTPRRRPPAAGSARLPAPRCGARRRAAPATAAAAPPAAARRSSARRRKLEKRGPRKPSALAARVRCSPRRCRDDESR